MCGQGNQLKLANIVNILLKEKPFSLINFDRVPDVSKHAWSPFLVLHHVVVDFRFCLSPLVYPSRAGSVARYSVGVLCSSTYERTEPKQQIFPNTHKTLPQKRLTWLISVSLVFLNSLANYRKSRLCLFFFSQSIFFGDVATLYCPFSNMSVQRHPHALWLWWISSMTTKIIKQSSQVVSKNVGFFEKALKGELRFCNCKESFKADVQHVRHHTNDTQQR